MHIPHTCAPQNVSSAMRVYIRGIIVYCEFGLVKVEIFKKSTTVNGKSRARGREQRFYEVSISKSSLYKIKY